MDFSLKLRHFLELIKFPIRLIFDLYGGEVIKRNYCCLVRLTLIALNFCTSFLMKFDYEINVINRERAGDAIRTRDINLGKVALYP